MTIVKRPPIFIRQEAVTRFKQATDDNDPRRYAASDGRNLDNSFSVRGRHKVIPYGEPQPCTPDTEVGH